MNEYFKMTTAGKRHAKVLMFRKLFCLFLVLEAALFASVVYFWHMSSGEMVGLGVVAALMLVVFSVRTWNNSNIDFRDRGLHLDDQVVYLTENREGTTIQMAASCVVLAKCADAPVKLQELFTQTAPHRQQRLQGVAQEAAALGNLLHLLLEGAAAAFPFAQNNPEGLQRAADLVHRIGAHADELDADTEHGTGRVACQAFDADFPIPPHPDNLCQSLGIVLVGLVDLKAEGSLSMPGVEADNGQAHCLQCMPVPGRKRAALQSNPDNLWCFSFNGLGYSLGSRGALATPDGLPIVIDDAQVGSTTVLQNPAGLQAATYKRPVFKAFSTCEVRIRLCFAS